MNEQADTPKIVLKANNLTANEYCSLCGDPYEAEQPTELFIEGTYAVVCELCSLLHAPMLFQVKLIYNKFFAATNYAGTVDELGEFFTFIHEEVVCELAKSQSPTIGQEAGAQFANLLRTSAGASLN